MTPHWLTHQGARHSATACHPAAAVLVTVTCLCMCFLHMLCQMAENEGVALAGEAGVFPSLLPDNTPSGAGELLPPPLTSLPAGGGGGTNARRKGKKMGWDWGLGEKQARQISSSPRQRRRNSCRDRVRVKGGGKRAWSWDFKIFTQIYGARSDMRREFKESLWGPREEILKLMLIDWFDVLLSVWTFPDCLSQTDPSVWRICDRWGREEERKRERESERERPRQI